jgi:hypothetical protein|tara:strand:+ start:2255 stop:2665 length:411 start_codon:yes stop_codon:yes gene_type:complete
MPYAGSILKDLARSADAALEVNSAAILRPLDDTGLFTKSSAIRCSGVHRICISGGEMSCDAATAVVSSWVLPVATRVAARAGGTKKAPPIVKQSRSAKSAYDMAGTTRVVPFELTAAPADAAPTAAVPYILANLRL